MSCIFLLNDSELNMFWKKNIFKMEKIIFFDSVFSIFFSFLALLTFPFDSFRLVKQIISVEFIIYNIYFFSIVSLLFSILIKHFHIKRKIRPNYRLCLMNFLAHLGLFSFIISLFSSLYINHIIIEWEGITGIITYRALSSEKIVISIGKAIYTVVLSYILLVCTFLGTIDFYVEILIITIASKYLSEGNNINNNNLLFELFKIPIKNNTNNIDKRNNFNNSIINNDNNKDYNFKKRLVILNNVRKNDFENENNEFKEVEIIQNVEYHSIGIQTENVDINIYYNNNAIDNKSMIDEDLSSNCILIKNKSLLDSKSTFNEIMNAPIK